MRIEQLEYVLEIARQKSFSMAANHLHISQQSLSQSIKNLEQELGVELFARTNRGAHQTKEGELVVDFSREMLSRYGQLREQLQDLGQKPKQQKRVEYTCPQCGQKLHWIKGKKGDFLGHDRGSKCRATYQSFAEIKGYKEK